MPAGSEPVGGLSTAMRPADSDLDLQPTEQQRRRRPVQRRILHAQPDTVTIGNRRLCQARTERQHAIEAGNLDRIYVVGRRPPDRVGQLALAGIRLNPGECRENRDEQGQQCKDRSASEPTQPDQKACPRLM